MNKIRKLRRLSNQERGLLVQSTLLLPLTVVGISFLGIVRWQRLLTAIARRRASLRDVQTSAHAQTISRMVRTAADHGVYRANCLPQALVSQFLLQWNGIDSEVRFGARKQNGDFEAHAWVEINGVILNDDDHVCRDFFLLDRKAATIS